MRALVIAPQPFFSPRGTPFSVYYRALIMAELGVEQDLLTYGEGEDVVIKGVRIVRIPRFGWLGNVRTGPSALKLFLDVFVVLWTLGMLLRRRYDFVHAHEESVFFCRVLKPLFGFRLLYDMHSSLPQQLKNFEFTESKLVHGIFERQERLALERADAVITICPDLADYATGVLSNPDKHFLIENSIFDPVQLKDSASPQSPEVALPPIPTDRRLIVYAGTLEKYQGIDLLLEGFAQVEAQHPDAHLLIVGGSESQVTHFRAMAAKLGLSECTFTGRLPQQQADALSARASVLVSPRSSGTNTPLKIYRQLASGIPLVATAIYSHTQVLEEDVAWLVEASAAGMAGGIDAALGDPALVAEKVRNARALYEEKYSRDIYIAKMRDLLAVLTAGRGAAEVESLDSVSDR